MTGPAAHVRRLARLARVRALLLHRAERVLAEAGRTGRAHEARLALLGGLQADTAPVVGPASTAGLAAGAQLSAALQGAISSVRREHDSAHCAALDAASDVARAKARLQQVDDRLRQARVQLALDGEAQSLADSPPRKTGGMT